MNGPAPQTMTHADIKTIAAALGIEKRTAERRASKDAWPFIEQPGRGGKKRLYPLNSLPKAVREPDRRNARPVASDGSRCQNDRNANEVVAPSPLTPLP